MPNMKSYSLENQDICSEIIGNSVKAVSVLQVWESVASSIPPEYETYTPRESSQLVGEHQCSCFC